MWSDDRKHGSVSYMGSSVYMAQKKRDNAYEKVDRVVLKIGYLTHFD